MTPQEWDEKRQTIRDDLTNQGEPPIYAALKADSECRELFGQRPNPQPDEATTERTR